jgi:hypothetical protein
MHDIDGVVDVQGDGGGWMGVAGCAFRSIVITDSV